MLKINNIKFSYNKKDSFIFDDISFDIKKSEIISVIGRSGLGKTTLLNLISGLLKPNSGNINLNDSTINSTQLDICYLKQRHTLLFYRNVLENTLLNSEIRNQLTPNKINKAKELIDRYGLENALDKFPEELSEGMKQRVGIIQTLITEAKLYLFDEPFSSIDSYHSKLIENDIWSKIKANCLNAIIISHDLEQAVAISDRIILLPSNNKSPIIIDLDKNFKNQLPSERRKQSLFSKELLKTIQCFSEN